MFVIYFRPYNLKKLKQLLIQNFQVLLFVAKITIYLLLHDLRYCTYEEWVHMTNLFKSNIKHYYHSIYLPSVFPRIVNSNCLCERKWTCSKISRNTLSLSTVVSLLHFLGITLFFGFPLPVRTFELHCIWYTASSHKHSVL